MVALGITDHVEGPADRTSADVLAAVIAQTELAERLGVEYAWFAEHHAHAHAGHLPDPLLLALHLAGRTQRIRLGSAVICLNLHHPLSVAERCATADLLMGGRAAFGFGSGSTPGESALFSGWGGGNGAGETGAADGPAAEEAARHRRAAEAMRLIQAAWAGRVTAEDGAAFGIPAHRPLPVAAPDLADRSWLAVNSEGAARVAAGAGLNVLFSHLRTPAQYRTYAAAYRSAGGRGLIAVNRPIHVAATDGLAFDRAGPALRTLWRRFRAEGKIAADQPEPASAADLCKQPINFLIGGPATVARQLEALRAECPFDVVNAEVRWSGLTDDAIADGLSRLAGDTRPLLGG